MARFKVTKKLTYTYEAYVEAEDWEEAEEKARYDGADVEWEDVTNYYDDGEFDVEEEEE